MLKLGLKDRKLKLVLLSSKIYSSYSLYKDKNINNKLLYKYLTYYNSRF